MDETENQSVVSLKLQTGQTHTSLLLSRKKEIKKIQKIDKKSKMISKIVNGIKFI